MSFLLNDVQLNRLSEFTTNLGLVVLASAITPLFAGVDKVNLFIIVLGVLSTISCLLISLFLLKGVKS